MSTYDLVNVVGALRMVVGAAVVIGVVWWTSRRRQSRSEHAGGPRPRAPHALRRSALPMQTSCGPEKGSVEPPHESRGGLS